MQHFITNEAPTNEAPYSVKQWSLLEQTTDCVEADQFICKPLTYGRWCILNELGFAIATNISFCLESKLSIYL